MDLSLRRILVLALVASGLVLQPTAHADLPAFFGGQATPSLAPMLQKAMPGVVNISTKTQIEVAQHPLLRDPAFRQFFDIPYSAPQKRETSSLGSGVIVDAHKGYVITNNHVIDKADEILVTLKDGRHLSAKLIGADPQSDIAVIQIKADNLTALPIADSASLQVGDFCVAIGNPFGLGQTVTSGIISALGRSGLGIEGYEDFIQTDASINPGNSGGALVNLRGELIGVNTAIIAPGGGNVGIGFAIPSNMATQIKDQLIEHGEVKRGLLGVSIQDLTPELAQAFQIKESHGAVVAAVQPDSPANRAGIEPGDVVLSINGRQIRNSADVRNTIGLLKVNDEVDVEVIHAGERVTRTAKIAAPKLQQVEGQRVHPRLAGVLLRSTGPNDRIQGIQLERVHKASYAWGAGLRPGDVITMVNRQPVHSVSELESLLADNASEILLNVQRGENAYFLVLR